MLLLRYHDNIPIVYLNFRWFPASFVYIFRHYRASFVFFFSICFLFLSSFSTLFITRTYMAKHCFLSLISLAGNFYVSWCLYVTTTWTVFFTLGQTEFTYLNMYSLVGIATELRAGRFGFESRWDEIFRLSRPALGPTQPPVKWVTGLSRA